MKVLQLIPLHYEHIYNTIKHFEMEDLNMWQILLQNFTNIYIVGSWAYEVNNNKELKEISNLPFIYQGKNFISKECNCSDYYLPRLVSIKSYTNKLLKYDTFKELIWYKNRFKSSGISLLELEDYMQINSIECLPKIDLNYNCIFNIDNIYPILPNVFYDHAYGPATHIELFHNWKYNINASIPNNRYVYVYGENPLKDYLSQKGIYKPIIKTLETLYNQIKNNTAQGILKNIKFISKSSMYTYENTPVFIALNETQVKNIKKYSKYSQFYIVHYWSDNIQLYKKRITSKKWNKLYL